MGGPGTGKTTLINALKNQGYIIFEEVSRKIIKNAQLEGVKQLFLADPFLFSKKLLEGRIAHYKAAEGLKENHVLYDRGIPDIIAYLNYANEKAPPEFAQACEDYRYDRVLMLPPWEAIHTVDEERYEDFEKATQLHNHLVKTYKGYNYNLIAVPKATVEERVNFVKKILNQ
ncbi:MAG: ATP-binding protein [Leeuwenhoekiella sp.]